MAMKPCKAGEHFYNHDMYEQCPTCEQENAGPTPVGNINKEMEMENKTKQINPVLRDATDIRHERKSPIKNNGEADNKFDEGKKTRVIVSPLIDASIEKGKQSSLPVTGWLVIVDGTGKGKDFRLVQGNNRIGRDSKMNVCLDFGADSDSSVSRNTHAIVVYDNNANEFFVERGESANLPTINGKTVRGQDQDLNSGDILQLGETKLMLFSLCSEQFKW